MESQNFTLFRFVSAVLCFVAITKPSFGQLIGTYTINPSASASSTNYKDFHSAVADLDSGKRYDGGTANGKGVSGPVAFNIADGSYKEKVNITYISGSSATNNITFQSKSKDSTKVILYSPSDYSKTTNYTLQIDSTPFVTFRQMTIQRTGTLLYGQVVNMFGLLEDDTFSGCRFLGTFSSGLPSNIVMTLTNNLDIGICLSGNLVRYGYNGLVCSGSRYINSNLVLSGNQFDSAENEIISIVIDSVTFIKNIITNSTRGISISAYYAAFYSNTMQITGIYNQYSVGGYHIAYYNNTLMLECQINYSNGFAYTYFFIGNKMHLLEGGNGVFTIRSDYNDVEKNIIFGQIVINMVSGSKCKFINNFVYCNAEEPLSIENLQSSDISFYFNNIYSPAHGGYGAINIDQGSTGTLAIKDNNFVCAGGAVLSTVSGSSFPTSSDYNNYYSPDSTPFIIGYYNSLSLSDYQAASGTDSNSTLIDPKFVSDSDLHSTNTALEGKGIFIDSIFYDIDGRLRPQKPTIGANELDTSRFIIAAFNVDDNYIPHPVSFLDESRSSNCGKIDKWLWEFGDGATDTLESPSHSYTSRGPFTVKLIVHSASGCVDSFSETFNVDSSSTAAISSVPAPQADIKIYPNPFNNTFTIETGSNTVKSIELLDITGRDVTEMFQMSSKPLQIQAGNLPSGIYFIRVNFENGNCVAKVVKE